MATTKKTPKRSKPKPEAEAVKTGFAEHPMLIGMTEKAHARLVRAAKKADLAKAAFVRLAVETAVSEVL